MSTPGKVGALVLLGIGALVKLLITGVMLSVGFRLGGLFMAEAEKKVANRKKKPAVA